MHKLGYTEKCCKEETLGVKKKQKSHEKLVHTKIGEQI